MFKILQKVRIFSYKNLVAIFVIAPNFLLLSYSSSAQEVKEYSVYPSCLKKSYCHKELTGEVIDGFGNHAFGFERDPQDNS
ncbi:MAG: hypothetical protein RIC87_20230 [Kiloniellales bacterium]